MSDTEPLARLSHVNPDDIDGLDELKEQMNDAETAEDWSHILKDYINWGNGMLKDNIGVFNVGTAHDCPNIGTEHCQVEAGNCYAAQDEKLYPGVIDYRRRQEYLWDSMPPDLFADAFLELVSRKRNRVDVLRFNESGDIRGRHDVIRMEQVAKRLEDHGITTYTYTASDWADITDADSLTINASNDNVEDADQRFRVINPEEEEIPEDGFHCPASDPEMEITCGECVACMADGGDDEIYVLLRER